MITQGVYVANQGNFSDANGSLFIYDPATESTAAMVDDAGSTIQSLAISNDKLYVMSNTGGRIDVFSLATGAAIDQIGGVASPRYMAIGPTQIAYVTNIFSSGFVGGSLSVIDLLSGNVTATVDVGDNPEGVTIVGDRVYVANHGFGNGTTLSVLDALSNQIVETIEVGCDGPRLLFRDREDEVWVVCTGKTEFDGDFNIVSQTPGAVVLVDGPTGAVLTKIDLVGQVSTVGPGQDAFYSESEQELHVVVASERVLRFNTGANVLAEDLGVFAGDPIGAVAYDSQSDRLYLGRVPGFTVSGSLTIHERAGAQLASFPVGIAPTAIEFYQVNQ
jgi:hypothetical protein